MELHHANARIKDDQIEIVVGSQALDKVQRAVAHVLNLQDAQVPKFYLKIFLNLLFRLQSNALEWGDRSAERPRDQCGSPVS